MTLFAKPMVTISLLVLVLSAGVLLTFSGTISKGTDKSAVQDEAALVQKGVALHRRGGEQDDQPMGGAALPLAGSVIPAGMYTGDMEGVGIEMPKGVGGTPKGGKLTRQVQHGKDKKYRRKFGSEALRDKKAAARVKRETKFLGPMAGMALAQQLADEKMARLDAKADDMFKAADGYGEDATPENLAKIRQKAKLQREIDAAKKAQLDRFNLKEFMAKRKSKADKLALQKKKKAERLAAKKANHTKAKVLTAEEKSDRAKKQNSRESDRKAKEREEDLADKIERDDRLTLEMAKVEARLKEHGIDE